LPPFLSKLSRVALVLTVLLQVCVLRTALAAPAPLLADFSHTAWGPQQGAPNDVVQFAQTPDGWLWLASANGLYRFDGVRFERMDSVQGQRLHSTNVLGLLATPDGTLWIGHRFGGISQVQNGRLRFHRPGDGLPAGSIFGIVRGPDGTIWAATNTGLAFLAPGAAQFAAVPAGTGLPQAQVYQVLFTRDGRQWVAVEGGLYYREPGARRYLRAWPHRTLMAMAEAPDGTLWASDGIDRHYRVSVGAPAGQPAARGIPGGTGMHFDRDGTMWVLKRHALERRAAPYLGRPGAADRAQAAQQLGQANGISGPLPQMWFQDREGNIWIGTSAGIDRLRPNRVRPLALEAALDHPTVIGAADGPALLGDSVGPVRTIDAQGVQRTVGPMHVTASYRAPDGAIWLGGTGIHWRREQDGRWRPFPHPAALARYTTHALSLDPDGRMWVALQTVGLFRVDATGWQRNGGLADLPPDLVMALARDDAGRTWVGYVGGRIACIDHDRVRLFGAADGIRLGNVQSLLVDGTRIWVGGEHGVGYIEDGRWTALAAPLRGVSGMVRTPEGELWLHGADGITRIGADEVARILQAPGRTPMLEQFDALDGLRGSAEQLRPVPTLARAADGRLWFTTASDVASIDPRRIPRNRLPPTVQILGLQAHGRTYAGTQVELPTGTSGLQIAYTALSLSMPERVRFRYRLHGIDDTWHDAGTRREAFYTNLAPGTYRFDVTAANEDGVWNDTGAHVDITLPPRFVQTKTFLALMVALGALALYGLYRLRVRHLSRRMNDVLHARLVERARIARGLHDTLLQSVQSMIMFFDQQARCLPQDAEQRRQAERLLALADRLMSEGRDCIHDLRASAAPQELGQALRDYGDALLSGRLAVTVNGRPRALVPLVRDELQTIAREALFNCARHAAAGKVELMIDYGRDTLRIVVRDDGCGTARPRHGHYGLSVMQERAAAIGATCTLTSAPGQGTTVDLAIDARRAYTDTGRTALLPRLRRRFVAFRLQ